MKNLIKLFFIALCFFISLCVNTHSDKICDVISYDNLIITESESIPIQEISVKPCENENSIVTANSQSHEISSINNDRKDLNRFGISDKSDAKNKLLQKFFTAKYNQYYWSASHKISPHLKNEICTRAP